MHRLEEQLATFRASLRSPDLPVVLAVSGGADSVALLRAWQATDRPDWGRPLVAHFNHQWRGDESERDAAFVEELARSRGLRCVVERADVDEEPIVRGLGPEARARRQRYAFLARVAAQQGARYLATAHTADDQVETILLRILRGTGIAGLAGIPQFRRLGEGVTVVRPWLEAPREELRDYLLHLGQDFREDSSNADLRFARNQVRRDLLPLLRQHYNPRIDDTLRRLGESARAAHQVRAETVERLAAAAVRRSSDGKLDIDCRQLAASPRDLVRQLFVHLWARENWPAGQMNRQRWNELAELTETDSRGASPPPRMFPGGIRAATAHDSLTLVRIQPLAREADGAVFFGTGSD